MFIRTEIRPGVFCNHSAQSAVHFHEYSHLALDICFWVGTLSGTLRIAHENYIQRFTFK